MVLGLLILMGGLALAALTFWILAIRLSYRIDRLRRPDFSPPRLALTNMFATAFMTNKASQRELDLIRQLRTHLAVSVGCLIATGVLSFFLPLVPRQPAPPPVEGASGSATDPLYHPAGTTLAYMRSNQDGSLPVRVLVQVRRPDEIHVVRLTEACQDAAYLIARIGPRRAGSLTSELSEIVSGGLTRAGEQAPGATVALRDGARALTVETGNKGSGPILFDAPPAPWRMYDLDLAEFSLLGPRTRSDFTFGLAMAWPQDNSPYLRILGEARVGFLYTSDGGAKHHFRVSGPAFSDPRAGDRGGEMITDATYGHVIEARFGLPNHPGYSNLLVRLEKVSPGAEGEAVWRSALTRHWQGCPG